MEIGFTPKTPNNRTINYLRKEGGVSETANQVRDALAIANTVLDVKDRIAVTSVEGLLKWAIPREGISCASYFDNARFTEEAKECKSLGIEKEGINDEAGIWGHRFFVEPTSEAEAVDRVKKGLHEARVQNLRGLMQIHQENIGETDYSFDDRTEPKNLFKWRDLVARHRAGGVEAFKEWDNIFDRNLGIQPRETAKRDDESLFDVVSVSSDDQIDRGFEKIINEKKVAKVILFKNAEGKVTSIEMWYPHFTNDEAEGRKILKAVGSKFESDPNKIDDSVNILRSYQLKDSDGESVNILDMEGNFRLSEEEKRITDMALRVLDINRSAYFAYSWLSVEPEKSAYICVDPGSTETQASGLQFAILPSPAEIKKLAKPLQEATWHFAPRIINMVNRDDFAKEVAKPVIESMRSIATYSRAEIRKAKKALATLSILGVYLGDISRKIFKSAFNKHHKLFAEGSFQVSSVNYKSEQLKNVSFITATNATAKRVLSINSDEKGVGCNLRVVSDRAMQNEIYLRLGRTGLNRVTMEDFKDEAKKLVREKQIKFRRALVFMSLMVLHDNITNRSGMLKDRRLQEVYNTASTAFQKINDELLNSGK